MMGVLARIPEPVRKAIASALPDSWVNGARRMTLRRFDPSIVVERESGTRRWFNKHVLRLYYLPSLVTRESALRRWYDTGVRHLPPRLYHFEVHVVDHCNLNCKGCGHFSNICPPTFLSLEEFDRDFAALAARLRVDDIWLLGGEPLLHPQLPEFVRHARAHFPDAKISVMTNGTLVTRMGEEFWLAMRETRTVLLCDLYQIGLPVAEIDELAERHGVAIEWTDPRGVFFKVPIDVAGTQEASNSFLRCEGLNNCPMLRHGRLYPCAYAAYADVFAEKFGVTGIDVTEADSVSVTAEPAEIDAFLHRPIPWCSHCDFDSFEVYPWERSSRQIDEWITPPSASRGDAA